MIDALIRTLYTLHNCPCGSCPICFTVPDFHLGQLAAGTQKPTTLRDTVRLSGGRGLNGAWASRCDARHGAIDARSLDGWLRLA